MPATAKEVAARAGVSVSTVSRVLNDRPGASAETRRRVLEAVEELQEQDATLQLRYRASRDWEPEEVDSVMIRNLMKSEIESLQQEHD